MPKYKDETIGFGFNSKESRHCFIVDIPRKKTDFVNIYEQNNYDTGDKILKTRISKDVWGVIAPFIEKEFNFILDKCNIKKSKFKIGENLVDRLLGKELCLLIFAIESLSINDSNSLLLSVHNWLSIDREFRWFLFTMVDNTSSSTNQDTAYYGWRKAIKIAFLDNLSINSNIKKAEVTI